MGGLLFKNSGIIFLFFIIYIHTNFLWKLSVTYFVTAIKNYVNKFSFIKKHNLKCIAVCVTKWNPRKPTLKQWNIHQFPHGKSCYQLSLFISVVEIHTLCNLMICIKFFIVAMKDAHYEFCRALFSLVHFYSFIKKNHKIRNMTYSHGIINFLYFFKRLIKY